MPFLFGTDNGLLIQQTLDSAPQCVLEGEPITAVIAREGVILVGTPRGIWRSDDEGAHWQPASSGLEDKRIVWLTYHPATSDVELAGTPTAIYLSHNGGATWQRHIDRQTTAAHVMI